MAVIKDLKTGFLVAGALLIIGITVIFFQILVYTGSKNTSDFLMVGFNGIVAFATLVYAVLTWFLVTETRMMRQAQTEPKIMVTVDSNPVNGAFKDLIIENAGSGPAFGITFSTGSGFETLQGKKFQDLDLIKNGIPFLSAGQSKKTVLTYVSPSNPNDPRMLEVIKLRVTYSNSVHRDITDDQEIDLSKISDPIEIPEPSRTEMIAILKKMNASLEKIAENRKEKTK